MATPYEDLQVESVAPRSATSPAKQAGYAVEPEQIYSDPSTRPGSGDISVFTGAGTEGLVPDPSVETGRFLSDDGTWQSVLTTAPIIYSRSFLLMGA